MTKTNTIINETVNTDVTATSTDATATDTKKKKKVTIADMYAKVREVLVEVEGIDSNLVAFIDERAAMAEKRNSNRKPSKAQEENEGIKTSILELLKDSEPMRNGDIAAALGISPQKASSLLSQLRKNGAVKREYEKKIAYFSV